MAVVAFIGEKGKTYSIGNRADDFLVQSMIFNAWVYHKVRQLSPDIEH